MATIITGKIQIDGVETEFVFDAGNGSWQQWGGTREELGARVEYLEAMERGLAEDTDYFSQKDEDDDVEDDEDIKERLEYLRGEIEAERISMGEVAELQDLAKHIDRGDVLLLQWAGVPEFEDEDDEQ